MTAPQPDIKMTEKRAKEISGESCKNDSHCQYVWEKGFGTGYLQALEQERQVAKGLVKALEYCAVEPELLKPENNRQCAVAMNALATYKARIGG